MVADKETGLFQNHFRDYDPSKGGYPEADPIGLYGGSWSPYVYANNSPLMLIDPLGLCWIYTQSTGQLNYQPPASAGGGPPEPIGTGYSGISKLVNFGALEMAQNIGPIPVGTYSIGPQQIITTHNADGSIHSTLLGAMRLTPDPGQYIWNRNGFIIHGSKDYDNHTGSNGCPIFKSDIRDKIGKSGDTCFQVIP